MPEYIEREALLEEARKRAKAFSSVLIYEAIKQAPTADVVSREVFEQVKWERDTALQTLEEHGIGLGQKTDVVKVKHGEWLLRSFLPTSTQKYPYKFLICSQCCNVSKKYTKHCPHCGAKMDGATDTNVGGKLKEGAEE
jgi:hypothetical protein